ncbi:MAG: CcoQ/FixQ family Cbb3-type cytochrome c oxidase assembly chaperone [Tunicatimonas sp.]
MLKFIKHHMETIAGIEIFPLISFLIFFTFFVLLLVWVLRSSKEYFVEVERLPLDQPDTNDIDYETL